MKFTRKNHKKQRKHRNTRTYQKGAGKCGPRLIKNTLDRFANYWYNNMKRDAWYGEKQSGYYFSNRYGCKNCYQAQTHTHIYEIVDLDARKDGMKKVKWTTKINDEPHEKTLNPLTGIDDGTDMPYTDIADWLIAKNTAIGADYPCIKE